MIERVLSFTGFKKVKKVLFILFFLSGFCGLLYQVVWLRLAFSAFGILTPVMSVVIAVFMAGLALGSFLGGKYVDLWTQKTRLSALHFYAACELLTAIGALFVPKLFFWGSQNLLYAGEMQSTFYLLKSALIITLALLPWCICMGFTFPFVMAYIRTYYAQERSGFSFLYLANVVGAMTGAALTALLLIELFGFLGTLWLAATVQIANCIVALSLQRTHAKPASDLSATLSQKGQESTMNQPIPQAIGHRTEHLTLFLTGFVAMALEVAWVRAFTPVLRTTIYSFALLLVVYLFATWLGSWWYRQDLANKRVLPKNRLVAFTTLASFLPILAGNPDWTPTLLMPTLIVAVLMVLMSIFPFCLFLGYLTPCLIDEISKGCPKTSAYSYVFNIVGSILGPLIAGYWLLPLIGAKYTQWVFSLMLFLLAIAFYQRSFVKKPVRRITEALVGLALLIISFLIPNHESGANLEPSVLFRDHSATVIAHGRDMKRMLLVNGYGITELTTITKFMSHLPLAHLNQPGESALVICFGMGTTFRSLLTWPLKEVYAVELIPSVVKTFSFFHKDANEVLADPRGHIIIDDGRRFLARSSKKFDVITLDPPPPVEAAGSSLLYSEEFLHLVKSHLKEEGILQHWFPGGEQKIFESILAAIRNVFPHVIVFHSVKDWGYHFLASQQPIVNLTAGELLERLPPNAIKDLLEWEFPTTPQELVTKMISNRWQDPDQHETKMPLAFTDDRPMNEYFLVRRTWDRLNGQFREYR